MKYIQVIFVLILVACVQQNNKTQKEEIGEAFEDTTEIQTTEIKEPQNIIEFFLILPESIIPINITERQVMLDSINNPRQTVSGCANNIEVLDKTGGFLTYSCYGDGGYTQVEITYWNLPDKSRMIAVNKTYGGMCCDESYLDFYKFNNGKWNNITSEVFPKIKLTEYINKENLVEEDYNKDAALLIKLPQKGKDILALIGGTIGDEGYNGNFNVIKYRQITMKFDNGKFVMGEKE